MQASAGFVSASALGMACGPALACLLQTNFKIYKLTFNEETLPGWLMALAWLVYLLWLWVSFREPPRETKENLVPQEANSGMSTRLLILVNYSGFLFLFLIVTTRYILSTFLKLQSPLSLELLVMNIFAFITPLFTLVSSEQQAIIIIYSFFYKR
jgi:hypothetical protein